MADVNVILSFLGTEIVPNGQPQPVKVRPGETLAWKSLEGEVKISLPDAPLAGARAFTSRKGEFTAEAKVLPNAKPGTLFECQASIGGKHGTKVYGIEIVP